VGTQGTPCANPEEILKDVKRCLLKKNLNFIIIF